MSSGFYTPSAATMEVPQLNYSSPATVAPMEVAAVNPVAPRADVQPVAPVTDATQQWKTTPDASLNAPANVARIDKNDATAQSTVHVVTDASQIPAGQQPAVVIDAAKGETREATNLKGDEKDIYVLVNGSSQQATEAANAAAAKLADLSGGKAAIDDQSNLISQQVKDKFGKGTNDKDGENGGDGKDGGNDGNDGCNGGGGGGDKKPIDPDEGKDPHQPDENNNNNDKNRDQNNQALEAAKRLAHSVVGDHSLNPGVPGRFLGAHLGSAMGSLLARMHHPPTPEELAELQKELEKQSAELAQQGADATKNGDTATGDALTQLGKTLGDKAKLDPSSSDFQQFAGSLQNFTKAQADGTLTQAQVSALLPTNVQEAIATSEVMKAAKEQNVDLSKPSDTPAYQDAIKRLVASLQLSDVNKK